MLFNRIDEETTINNAKAMLSGYQLYHQLAKKVEVPPLQSPIISDMPKSRPDGNSQEDKVIDYISRRDLARYYCIVIDKTIEAIEDEIKRYIITECYISCRYDNGYIMDRVGVAETRYYELKREAVLTFAEICPGQPSIDDDGNWQYEPLISFIAE